MASGNLSRARPFWIIVAAACLVPAALNSLSTYLNSKLAGVQQLDGPRLILAASIWLIFGLLTPIIYFLARRFPFSKERFIQILAVHFFGAVILCFAWASTAALLGLIFNRRPPQVPVKRFYVEWLLVNLPWSVFLYFSVLGSIYAFTYYREVRERESQQARLSAQLAEAKLSALRMQLHPHFLFNSLNAITVLVRNENTRDAARMLELLSGLLRHVLENQTRQESTLDEELHFIERYLAIEQVRFSDRLQVRWSIEPDMRDALVPEFILQPLVENAVRHGIAKRSEAGVIEVSARQVNNESVLSIQDNGPGYRPQSASGLGIANTRARLATLFGNDGGLEITNHEEGTVATLRFPLRWSKDE
jgi:signal transduction histidine kinase